MMAFFLHNANQQNDADERNDAELHVEKEKSKDGADAGGRKRGENRDGVNVALVEHAENNVNGDERGQNQDGLVGERIEEGRRRALKCRLDAGGHVQFVPWPC